MWDNFGQHHRPITLGIGQCWPDRVGTKSANIDPNSTMCYTKSTKIGELSANFGQHWQKGAAKVGPELAQIGQLAKPALRLLPRRLQRDGYGLRAPLPCRVPLYRRPVGGDADEGVGGGY